MSTRSPITRSRFWQSPLFWAAAAGACVEIGVIAGSAVPLGVPGEWSWQRLPSDGNSGAMLLLAALSLLPAAAGYLAVCYWGLAGIESRGRMARCVWLTLLSTAAFAWLWCVIDASPDPVHRLGRGPIVHYYPAFSGYFLEARRPDDFSGALEDYEAKMADGDVLHIGTHPPGLIIAHRGLLAFFRGFPAVSDLVLAIRPASVRDAQNQVIVPFPVGDGPPLAKADLAALWAATLIVMLAGALTVIPLYMLAAAGSSRRAGWQAACFWPLVPALAIFIPKSDALLPLLGMGIVAAWWPSSRRSRWGVVVAAVLFWVGMLTTLATLTIGCLLLLLTLYDLARVETWNRRDAVVRTAWDILLAGEIVAVCTLVFWLLSDVNLINVWWWNFVNHERFYSEYDRTYWKWLIANPIELCFAVGLPLVAMIFVGWRGLDWRIPPLVPVFATVGLLWLSGKNSGEAARLWLFLMPWLIWISAGVWSRVPSKSVWFAVLVVQLVTAFVVISRASGFEFQRFLVG